MHAALRYKRPVYIELPRDLVFAQGIPYHRPQEIHEESDSETLHAALTEAAAMINAARKPVILADVELHRFALQDVLLKISSPDQHSFPWPRQCWANRSSAKNSIHFIWACTSEAALGREDVRRYVETSDCVIMLGAFLTDINLGIYTAQLDPLRTIYANSEKLSIRYHTYENVRFKDFMRGLLKLRLRHRKLGKIPTPAPAGTFRARLGETKITIKRLFQRLNAFLDAKI